LAAVILEPLLRQEYTHPSAPKEIQETEAQYVTRRLSELLGHRDHDSWLKLLRTAKKQGLEVPWEGSVKPEALEALIRIFSAAP